jgi:hypothetical protein
MNPLWQNVLIYVLVLWCLWRLFGKYSPNMAWQTQAKISYFFESQKLQSLKYLGQVLRPAMQIPQACDTHCSSCRKCA